MIAMSRRAHERGFSLLELMVTVAIIAILASIALPSFTRESRKARALAEVQPLFNDLRVRLEQYLQENGRYPVTAGEVTSNPAGAPGTKAPLDLSLTDWASLRLRISGEDSVYCRYTWATGPALGGTIGAQVSSDFGFTAPSTEWYYLVAKCDMDNDGSNFSYYFTHSTDQTIQRLREGD